MFRRRELKFNSIRVISFFLLLFIVLSFSLSFSGGGFKQVKELVYTLGVLSTPSLGFAVLPLYIRNNLKKTKLQNDNYLYFSSFLTFLCLLFVLVFFIRYASTRGSGFSDGDVSLGFFSALFLVNSYFFIISLIVRKKANLFIHKLDYLFGVMMLLVAFSSTWAIAYLLCKVFCT